MFKVLAAVSSAVATRPGFTATAAGAGAPELFAAGAVEFSSAAGVAASAGELGLLAAGVAVFDGAAAAVTNKEYYGLGNLHEVRILVN